MSTISLVLWLLFFYPSFVLVEYLGNKTNAMNGVPHKVYSDDVEIMSGLVVFMFYLAVACVLYYKPCRSQLQYD